ncbi:MAG: rhomboid family intramembrane serine protease [Dysgonamonadaceae bacterium]
MITIVLIIFTCIISIKAFKDDGLMEKWIFYPPAVKHGEWPRLFTYGFLHADFTHLIFNMFTLYFFGVDIEKYCIATLGELTGSVAYIVLYFSALFVSIFPTYLKERDNDYYHGLGASGAVSAIIFAYVLINPMNFMGVMFIPVWLPAFLFAIIFVMISVYLSKNHSGGINHSAHIAGGIYGIVFMIVAFGTLEHVNLLADFIDQIHVNSIRDLIRFGF